MLEEISFGKEYSNFVIKQNIPLDALVEGEPIEREYEVTLYNAIAPISQFPELEFYSLMRIKNGEGIVELSPQIVTYKQTLTDLLKILIGGGGGAALGSSLGNYIGEVPGAVIGAVAGGLAGLQVTNMLHRLMGYQRKSRGTKIVEIIKGEQLKSNSEGNLSIDDRLTLFFGNYHYSKRLTTFADREENIQAVNEIREVIRREESEIGKQLRALFAENISLDIAEDSPHFSEYKKLHDILTLFDSFLSVFGDNQDILYLRNKIMINSDFGKNRKWIRRKKEVRVGDIIVKIGRGYKKSEEDIVNEVSEALYGRGYFLENSLMMNLSEIMERERNRITRRFKDSPKFMEYLKETFPIPFCVVDKKNRATIYGILNLSVETSNLEIGIYFSTKDASIHQI